MTRNNSLRFFSVGGRRGGLLFGQRERDSMRLFFGYDCIENSSLHCTDHPVSSNDKKLQASKYVTGAKWIKIHLSKNCLFPIYSSHGWRSIM